ncbi:RdgB/HAM1 family non-canonical purine NTP pyrophosphatase [bacterium]|nr:RdgB/HAM1 family non-canonical purine NTP pyrophosphatase [bacterium]MBU1985391.1 RdgB/HAM1 family non-canonical purine NTP pyrophosphatase [bacterium]
MARRIVVATNNPDKFREIQEKLSALPLALQSLADFPFCPKVTEDRPDLEGNAIKKATEVWRVVGQWTLADDTGLEVAALGGAPGVYSARYSGPGATYESNCRKLLDVMRDVPDGKRAAAFWTVICLRTDDGLYCVEGVLEGTIGRARRGDGGFGYDPVFVLRDGRTLAELSLAEKNRVSHRGQALDKMTALLSHLLKTAERS